MRFKQLFYCALILSSSFSLKAQEEDKNKDQTNLRAKLVKSGGQHRLSFIEKSLKSTASNDFVIEMRLEPEDIRLDLNAIAIKWKKEDTLEDFNQGNVKTEQNDNMVTVRLEGFPISDAKSMAMYVSDTLSDTIDLNDDHGFNHWDYEPFSTLLMDNESERSHRFEEKDLSSWGKHEVVYLYDYGALGNRWWKQEKEEKKSRLNFNHEKLKSKANLRVKVVNVNRYLYNVEINDSLINYTSPMPRIFRELFYPDSSQLASGLINSLSGSLGFSGKEGLTPVDGERDTVSTSLLDILVEKLEQFYIRYNKLNAITIRAYNRCGSLASCSELSDSQIGNYYYELNMELMEIKTLLHQLEGEVGESLKSYDKISTELEKDRELKKEIKELEAILEAKKKAKAEAGNAEEKKALDAEVAKLNDKVKEKKKDTLSDSEKKQKEAELEKAKEALAYHKTFLHILDDLPEEKELREKQIFVNNMTSHNNYVQLDHVPLKGDELELEIKITPKKDAENFGIYDQTNFKAYIPIKGVKFSFSQGVFLGQSRNKTYSWQAIPSNNAISSTSGQYQLEESGYTNMPAGFAAFGNLHLWNPGSCRLGLSIGPGITIESEPRIAYLAGASFAFTDGHSKQVVFTVGAMGMNVNKLSNTLKYVSDQNIVYPDNTTNIDYYQEFKTGLFFSVSYTFFKGVKLFRGSNKPKSVKEDKKDKNDKAD